MYPFPHYGDFTAFTPVVPELYWNVYSAEERIKALCMEWVKLVAFTDAMVDTVNEQYAEITDDIQARYDALDAAVKNIQDIVDDMQTRLPQLVNDDVVTEIRRLINGGEFAEMLQAAIDEYWTQYEKRIVGVETGLQTLNGELTTERNARIAEDAQIRSDFADDIASVNETLAADVDRLELQDEKLAQSILNGRIPTRQYIEATKIGTYIFDTSTYYMQGACTDGTSIFAMLTTIGSASVPHSALVRLDTNLNVMASRTFEHSFHGNSLTYDAERNYIYAYIGTGRFAVIDPITLNIIKETDALIGGYDNISCFAVNDNYAVANVTGSNYYLLYKRFGNTFATFGGIEAPNTGVYNFRQDGVIHENVFYQLLSGKSLYNKSMIRAISVGGTVAGDFVITNQNQEFEGIFVMNGMFYVFDAIGGLYTIPFGSNESRETGPYYYGLMTATSINPAVELFIQYPLANADELSKTNDAFMYLDCNINNKTQIFQLKFPSWSGINLQKRNLPFRTSCFGQYELGSVNNDNHITTHAINIEKGQIGMVKYIPYSDTNYMVLYEMRAIKISDGTSKLVRILRAELSDLNTLRTKLENFFNKAIQEGFTIFDNTPTQMSGYGAIRVRGGNVAAYSCINLNV